MLSATRRGVRGEVFTDYAQYEKCMGIAELNWERCKKGQPRIDPYPVSIRSRRNLLAETKRISDIQQLKRAIQQSNELSKQGEDEKASALPDDLLARAVREKRVTWIRILSHHAAVISDSMGDVQRVRKYYEQSLASNPDNPMTLHGLAKTLRRQGETELADQCATKSYRAIQHSESEIDRALLELIIDSWPEFRNPQR